MSRKLRLALAATLLALAALSAAGSASAGMMGGGGYFSYAGGFIPWVQ